ncbi:hypothetical protein H0X06_00480 [Candidatus Dependentiae bacterium]|nr:hypothetical protein [Candidatus Dependentiae bacterium]
MFIKKNIAVLCPLLLISFSGFALGSSRSSATLKAVKISSSDKTPRRSHDKAAQELAKHYKSLALRAEGLINSLNYDDAIPLVVKLLKETEGNYLSEHTNFALDEVIGYALVFDHTRIDWKNAKQEFKKLTQENVNAYAQAQGHVWLGALRYLERGCFKNTDWAKNHFKKALSLNSNNRATAQAQLALGIIYSFEKPSLVKKMFTSKEKFDKTTAELRAVGMSYLMQAQSQTDSSLVAAHTTNAIAAITQDIEQAYEGFKLKTGMTSVIKAGTDALHSAKDSIKDSFNSLTSAK